MNSLVFFLVVIVILESIIITGYIFEISELRKRVKHLVDESLRINPPPDKE